MTTALHRSGTARCPGVLEPDRLRRLVLSGLKRAGKELPPKLLYDPAGSELFERITQLEEYYLPRAERDILAAHVFEIGQLAGQGGVLIEFGSGAGRKVRLLMDALRPTTYVPIDIAQEQLERVAAGLRREYPGLSVRPVCADYTAPLRLPRLPRGARRVGFFPGSTIGNFHPPEAARFLRRVRRTLGSRGLLVLGVDRVKNPAVIEAAYNDARGITAAFNRNLLVRLNRELGADFDPAAFDHRAVFNSRESRVEMHLVSRRAQTVRVDGVPVRFSAGESIWTESSYKYSRARLEWLARAGHFSLLRLWTDADQRFWVAVLGG